MGKSLEESWEKEQVTNHLSKRNESSKKLIADEANPSRSPKCFNVGRI